MIIEGMVKGLDNYVSLEPEKHIYTDQDGREYESVSRFIGRFKKPFNADFIAGKCAGKGKYAGLSKKQVLAKWDKIRIEASNHGNRIHDALERFDKTTTIEPNNEDLRPMILGVSNIYKGYYRRVPEAILYDTDTFIAGTTDKLMQTTSHPKSVVDFDDYKTNLSKGIQYKSDYNQYLLGPLSHLQDCNYNTYALQLSIYAYLFQKKTGRNIGMLNILFIPPDDPLSFRRIPVPYMRLEVEAMFEYREMVDAVPASAGFNANDEDDF